MPEHDLKVRKRIYRAELGAYLLIVSVALFGFWSAEQDDKEFAQSQTCTEEFLAETVRVLEGRTSVNSDLQKADREQNIAWSKYVAFTLQNTSNVPGQQPDQKTLDTAIALVQDYFKKIQVYLTELDNAAKLRTDDPYPSRNAYRECLTD